MIVRRYLKVSSILRYTWRSISFFALVAFVAAYLYRQAELMSIAIPVAAVGPLGAALAIFLAFRNSSAYDRWWEARKLWGGLVNESRNFTRQITTFATGHGDAKPPDEELAAYHQEMVYRHVAYIHALRRHLRGQKDCDELERLLPEGEVERYRAATNVPAALAQRQGERLRDAFDRGYIESFRHMQLDSTMSRILDLQGGCERIKGTPLPRQYDYFPQVFLYVYAMFLPFGLVEHFGWFTAIISVPISFVFLVLQAAGRVNEDPFENRWTDTPMSTLSRMIEINLREQIGERELPEPLQMVDGVRY
ncbi:MAG: bestrophin family ion channel [Myxococcota bacterium]